MRIVLATDAVGQALRPIKVATEYLQSFEDSLLTVLYVSNGKVSFYNHTPQCLRQPESCKEYEHASYLEEKVHEVFHPWGRRVRFRHEIGNPVNTICQVAHDEQADLIIVGCHTQAQKSSPGPVSHGVLSRAKVPVLLAK